MLKQNSGADLFGDDLLPELTEEQEEQKKIIYAQMSPRRKKFVDRIGYARWNPFQLPKEPLDIRRDITKRTTYELVRDFLHSRPAGENLDNDYSQGVLESALGMVNKDGKFRGIYDFCLWYSQQLKDEQELRHEEEI